MKRISIVETLFFILTTVLTAQKLPTDDAARQKLRARIKELGLELVNTK